MTITTYHRDWIDWSYRCDAVAVRDGEEVPCERPAIAVAIYEDEGYAVCKHHARGRPMMLLSDLIATVLDRR